jgi:hypothetical protein
MLMAIPIIGKILDVLASSQVGGTSATQNTDGRKGPSHAGAAGPADFSQALHGLESHAGSTPAPLDASSTTKI